MIRHHRLDGLWPDGELDWLEHLDVMRLLDEARILSSDERLQLELALASRLEQELATAGRHEHRLCLECGADLTEYDHLLCRLCGPGAEGANDG